MVSNDLISKDLNHFINTEVGYYITLKTDESQLYNSVIRKLCTKLHKAMQQSDAYYKMYSSTPAFAGSHRDNLKITKPDEYDILFTIDLPSSISMTENKRHPEDSDVVIEEQEPGFVQLKMGDRFEELPDKPHYDINRTAYGWGDDEGYLLRSKFKDWFKKVIWKAFNLFESNQDIPIFRIKNRIYTIRRSEEGPAITLIIDDEFDFFMSVDLVPALKFPERRWQALKGYRRIPGLQKKNHFLVVPKPNKDDLDDEEAISRTWRLGLSNQEAMMMYHKHYLKPTIRLMKKLRDTQEMDKLTSYYIKTLFFWEIENQPVYFWKKNPTVILKHIVNVLYNALCAKELDYFWNRKLDFFNNISDSVLDGYKKQVSKFRNALDTSDTWEVAAFLLTSEELAHYRKAQTHTLITGQWK